ncbi:hypothetical protein EBB59_10925 [Lysobacter pythonis]|uniref:Uncharacterized protein n=2 Tax=Solilutibacter pythonis TaxID=2483112 RepID=A0A3M2HJE7_9GAMM|nr:hypothetical protein EBB59_10925 [Lysobacter pythonis]
MLRDYPEHIQTLQDDLNDVVAKPFKGTPMFEQAIWALEGALEAFIDEAREELRAAEASGDPAAIARAEEKISLMRRAHSSNGGMRDLHTLRMYFDANKRAFE